MTDRKRKRPALKRLRRQAVDADFDGGTLTSDGGLVLLREVDRRLDLIRRVDQAIPDPRDPIYTAHQQDEILISRIFGIAAGYQDANDHDALRHDPAFQVAAGRTPAENDYSEGAYPLASPSTHCRFENRIDSKAIFKLHEVLVDTFLDSFDEPPEEIILDYDATDDTVHGNQERRFFNGYYDSYCFLPLYVFCGDQILVSYLRPSSVGAAHHARPVTKLLVQKIRSRWPDVKIILRGDGGYADEPLMRWCDKNDVGYIFGLPKNKVLVREIACEMTRARIQQSYLGGKRACFKWFRYRTSRTWDRHRWVVGKAQYTGKGANPRFVVTNLPSDAGIVDTTRHRPMVDGKRQPWEVKEAGTQCSVAWNPEDFYRTMYCMRGEMENRIKEQQLCLFADRTSCTRFMANQFRLMLSSLAYVLVDGLRRLALSGTEHSRLRVDSIRLRLLKIAARVQVTSRRVVFHLCSHCPSAALWDDVMLRLCRSD
ncbi:Transposase DDE domain protein [Planctomycetes bacterium CA13]|uniref:Transposase DDE domain protein n=1 Tax=Novipirellula herctigrandis TaxID=2527986 RepID=A0A5C5ZDM0_9BACT|nr:Transposase DDE domain protein [Planctomycetes bacterium CA13]TWT76304.1 Transposase DDE domain protein [Planctomycetes bacterium CA13]TWT80118.1 Transposase DDE domain protein [Planctomycetes bacterium CA13]TWT84931.1 Transposase DDE domain protein [Planctomycetes bacterium CA13]